MVIRKYTNKESLLKEANKIGLKESDLTVCHASISYRIFKNKNCSYLHVYYF
jgi:hypothetical protein